MQVKKQQLEPDMEQWTGSKLGKEYLKAVYCHLANTRIEVLYTKDLNDLDNPDKCSLTWSQTFWSAKSSGPYEAPL